MNDSTITAEANSAITFPASQPRLKLLYLISSILAVLMLASAYYERPSPDGAVDWGGLTTSTKSSLSSGGGGKSNSKQKDDRGETTEHYYEHDFSYDVNAWEGPRGGPRIVVLAGPHKTASTTIQTFVASLASSTVDLGGEADSDKLTAKNRRRYKKKHRPHPSNNEWVWPVGYYKDYLFEDSMAGGIKTLRHESKYYATLAGILTGRRIAQYMPCLRYRNATATECQRKADTYYMALFRKVWEDEGNKNIVIGAEAFDTLVEDLLYTKKGVAGEDLHVSPLSGPVIDRLLGLFPWDGDDENTNNTTTSSTHQRPPLAMEDIEIHVNYRTPRSSHVVSIWHQLGQRKTLRKFLTGEKSVTNLYQTNSLALALQFARKGIKTTIIDMAGVSEHEVKPEGEDGTDEDSPSSSTEMTVIGGLQGVIACDILRMGRNNNNNNTTTKNKPLRCDDQSRLHIPGFDDGTKDKNQKHDRNDRDLTDGQIEEIGRLFEAYDCGVWKHLQKYQQSGTLRILYPSERLFGTCSTEDSENQVSFWETVRGVMEIASRQDGETPMETTESKPAAILQPEKPSTAKKKKSLKKGKGWKTL